MILPQKMSTKSEFVDRCICCQLSNLLERKKIKNHAYTIQNMQYSCYHLVHTGHTHADTHTHTHTHTQNHTYTHTPLAHTLTSTHKYMQIHRHIQTEREIGIPTLRESDIIEIFRDILIFTSKKTRRCSEFCVEGNTPWMFN